MKPHPSATARNGASTRMRVRKGSAHGALASCSSSLCVGMREGLDERSTHGWPVDPTISACRRDGRARPGSAPRPQAQHQTPLRVATLSTSSTTSSGAARAVVNARRKAPPDGPPPGNDGPLPSPSVSAQHEVLVQRALHAVGGHETSSLGAAILALLDQLASESGPDAGCVPPQLRHELQRAIEFQRVLVKRLRCASPRAAVADKAMPASTSLAEEASASPTATALLARRERDAARAQIDLMRAAAERRDADLVRAHEEVATLRERLRRVTALTDGLSASAAIDGSEIARLRDAEAAWLGADSADGVGGETWAHETARRRAMQLRALSEERAK